MSHPVATHPVLSSAFPDLAENLLMSTIAAVILPETMREAVFDRAKGYTVDRLSRNGVDGSAAEAFGDAVRKAAKENVVAFGQVASDLGLAPEKLCHIIVKVNDAMFSVLGGSLPDADAQQDC